jgi:hypothetical protein
MYQFLAETLIAIHVGYIAFVVGGLLLITIGAILGWNWVRNPWFRSLHLVMILAVVLEYGVGWKCPLTVWEEQLWNAAGYVTEEDQSFVNRLLYKVLHPPDWAFEPWAEKVTATATYIVAGLIVATFVFAPPRFRRKKVVVSQPTPPPSTHGQTSEVSKTSEVS